MLALLPILGYLATGVVAAPLQERQPGWFDDFLSKLGGNVKTISVDEAWSTQTVDLDGWDIFTDIQSTGTTIHWGDWDSDTTSTVASAAATSKTKSPAPAATTASAVSSKAAVSSASAKSYAAASASASKSSAKAISSTPSAVSSKAAASSVSAKSYAAAAASSSASKSSAKAVSSTAAPTSTKAPASTSKTATASSNLSSDAAQFLKLHNDFRAQYGAKAVTWNSDLEAYAKKAADTCNYGHTNGPYGENIAAGVGGGYNLASGFKSWSDESSLYDWNNPGYSEATGHFTQIVWKATTEIGCAISNCPSGSIFSSSYSGTNVYLVCEYAPPGNVNSASYFEKNVGRHI